MPVFWLDKDLRFPPPTLASEEGILAIGGDLSPERLLLAYGMGIFPWFNPGEPILWWSPDPRFVLFPKELKVAKSMRPYLNQQKFGVTFDQRFAGVMSHCRHSPRNGQSGASWITDNMIAAYTRLHHMGYAHSVEVWQGDALVGGLYGIALGKCFFGESMFTKVPNASKVGFILLVRWLEAQGFVLVDCQQQTQHLASLGARAIPRDVFLDILVKNKAETTQIKQWSFPEK
jgi:leucyl/phenylalanyl-tRNA--protein transferase